MATFLKGNDTDGPRFDLVCPKCDKHCFGKTKPSGSYRTYRNPYGKWTVIVSQTRQLLAVPSESWGVGPFPGGESNCPTDVGL